MINKALEESLITDEELSRPAEFIKGLKDPFEDWDSLLLNKRKLKI